MQLKDIIADICVIINQASDAKRDIQRGSQWGLDDVHNKQQQIDLLEGELSDAAYSLDKIKDSLYELLEAIEREVYNQEMAALSPFKKES